MQHCQNVFQRIQMALPGRRLELRKHLRLSEDASLGAWDAKGLYREWFTLDDWMNLLHDIEQ
jgi:hypothetical protein